jgi:hypothetical protein
MRDNYLYPRILCQPRNPLDSQLCLGDVHMTTQRHVPLFILVYGNFRLAPKESPVVGAVTREVDLISVGVRTR